MSKFFSLPQSKPISLEKQGIMKATCVVDNPQHIKVMQLNKKKRAEQAKKNKKETTTKTQEQVFLIMLGNIGLKSVQS